MATAVRVWLSHQPLWTGLAKQTNNCAGRQTRNFWPWLTEVFNSPDRKRIKELGPDRSCAEWLLRNGAHLRWKGSKELQTDYNTLPNTNFSAYKIQEINADNASLSKVGFAYLENCTEITKIRFHNCMYLRDDALRELSHVTDSLTHLEISSCGGVTDRGVVSLAQLQRLKVLLLFELPAVQDKTGSLEHLKRSLPDCDISWEK